MKSLSRKGFTLVELLVVIGIIAVLMAMLMPALSRARKQALSAACGSNARQITYAAIAYANDWREQLPTRIGDSHGSVDNDNPGYQMSTFVRLAVVGFDTTTAWDGLVCNSVIEPIHTGQCDVRAGGWAFMMRDYLKNDFGVVVCPDGLFSRDGVIRKDVFVSYPYRSLGVGYVYLPQRYPRETCNTWGNVPSKDRRRDIAHKVSGKPEFKVVSDLAMLTYDSPTATSMFIGANHRTVDLQDEYDDRNWDDIGAGLGPNVDPELLPLGMNISRIDAMVEWVPWQDIEAHRYASFTYFRGGGTCAAPTATYIWGRKGGL